MDGAVQPVRGGTLWVTVQNCHEKGRGPSPPPRITELMDPEAAGRITDQLFS